MHSKAVGTFLVHIELAVAAVLLGLGAVIVSVCLGKIVAPLQLGFV